jgi:hypothetical protein
MRDACAQVQATLHAREALAAAAHAQAARKKRRARADPTADAAAAAAAASAKRALANLAAQCAHDAAAACSAALFLSTSLAPLRVWGFRRQDAARLLARETKLAMVSSRGARFDCGLKSSQTSCILCVLGLIRGSLSLSLFLLFCFSVLDGQEGREARGLFHYQHPRSSAHRRRSGRRRPRCRRRQTVQSFFRRSR